MDIPRPLSLSVAVERWPIAGAFTISRGSKTEVVVVVAELRAGGARGRGECVPYARYGETVEGVVASIDAMAADIGGGLDRLGLQQAMPPGAARNALDCAFWDLEAKTAGLPVHELIGIDAPRPLITAFTISLADPDQMARAAERVATRQLLKVKLGGAGDPERIAAVRSAAPDATLIVDANEGWDETNLAANLAACAGAGVALIEQPLPAGRDQALTGLMSPVTLCADESVHDRATLAGLRDRYQAVNVKLDKAGGLTEALAMAGDAARLGFAVMTGCMVATSLAMAPAVLLAQEAKFVDLDGPLLLADDRPDALSYQESLIFPAKPALWG